MRYGDDKTIHRTGHVDVEVDTDGRVVSVWFRCRALPFSQTTVNRARADAMDRAYKEDSILPIEAIEFKDQNPCR